MAIQRKFVLRVPKNGLDEGVFILILQNVVLCNLAEILLKMSRMCTLPFLFHYGSDSFFVSR